MSIDKLIIFDLDETLIHANLNDRGVDPHFRFEEYFVYERPHLKKFLSDISRHFSIGIWSSASDDYVSGIVRGIKPPDVDFLIIWGRSKCTMRRDMNLGTYNYEKRLDKLRKKGFALENILIVDDSPEKSRANYGNAVYIKEFTGDRNDNELIFLYDYLLQFKSISNVRTVEKRGWRLNAGK